MRKADKARTVQSAEGLGESHQPEGKLHRGWSQALSVVLSSTTMAQPDTQEVPSEHEQALFVRGISHWHRLPQEAVETLSLEIFQSYLNTILVKWPHLIMDVGKGNLRGPFQHPSLYDANAEGLSHLLTAGAASSFMQAPATLVRETDKCHHHISLHGTQDTAPTDQGLTTGTDVLRDGNTVKDFHRNRWRCINSKEIKQLSKAMSAIHTIPALCYQHIHPSSSVLPAEVPHGLIHPAS